MHLAALRDAVGGDGLCVCLLSRWSEIICIPKNPGTIFLSVLFLRLDFFDFLF